MKKWFSFGKDYNSEKSLKKIASWILLCAVLTIVLAIVAGLVVGIVLCAEDDDLIGAGIATMFLGGPIAAAILATPIVIVAHMMWGFAELIGNSKRISDQSSGEQKKFDDILPEL